VSVQAIEVDAGGELHAPVGAVVGKVGDLGAVDQDLRRNTTDVQADPADRFPLDEHDASAGCLDVQQVGAPKRSDVAAWARTDHDNVSPTRHFSNDHQRCCFLWKAVIGQGERQGRSAAR